MDLFFCFRLALYVYEYLLHVGAQKAAQTFLNEVRSGIDTWKIIKSSSHIFIDVQSYSCTFGSIKVKQLMGEDISISMGGGG